MATKVFFIQVYNCKQTSHEKMATNYKMTFHLNNSYLKNEREPPSMHYTPNASIKLRQALKNIIALKLGRVYYCPVVKK